MNYKRTAITSLMLNVLPFSTSARNYYRNPVTGSVLPRQCTPHWVARSGHSFIGIPFYGNALHFRVLPTGSRGTRAIVIGIPLPGAALPRQCTPKRVTP